MPAWSVGRWVREPELSFGEEILWRRNANREQTSLRQVGGRLFLTNQRLLFTPNRFDDATDGASLSCPVTHVADVAVEPSGLAAPLLGRTARLRRRRRVELQDGRVELFVVNRADNASSTPPSCAEVGIGAAGGA